MNQDEEYIKIILETGSLVTYKILVEKYERRVFSICIKIIKKREEAEEVAQDVFVKCFKNLNRLKDPNKFPNWLMKIAYTKAIDQIRKKQLSKTNIDEISQEHYKDEKTPLTHAISENRKEIINKAIALLEPEEAAIITFYYIQGMTTKEISETIGMSLSNVKVKLFRARKTLKSIIVSLVKDDLKDFIQDY